MTTKTKFLTFFTIATLIYFTTVGTLGYQGVAFLTSGKEAFSKNLLLRSQNYSENSFKILLAEESNLLKSSDLARFEVFDSSRKIGNRKLANYYANQIRDVRVLDRLGEDYFENFRILYQQGYPQVATKYLRLKSEGVELNRDQYLLLASTYLEDNDYATAYQYLLKARDIDMYYPQTYKQLIAVCEKLGKTGEVNSYQKFYQSITF